MAGPHRPLLLPGESHLHRLAPEVKILAMVVFVIGVALTPRRAVPALVVDGLVVVLLLIVAGYRPRTVAARAGAIAPFLLLAAIIPFVATGEPIELDPIPGTVTADGLWAGWNTGAKTTIGFGASLVLAGTTSIPDFVRGLDRLRVPAVIVAVVSFMFRYLELLVDEIGRMRMAMVARGHDPRWLWQARPLASAAGALFVRSYERGERVHSAMLARGFTGRMPIVDRPPAPARHWIGALVVAVVPLSGAGLGAVTSGVV